MNKLFDMNGRCYGIVVLKSMFVTNGGVWETVVCSLVIWFSGGAVEITGTPLTLPGIGGVVLLEIVFSC